MRRDDEEPVVIDVEVRRVTQKAVLVHTDDTDDDVWIPKSQIDKDASEAALEEGASGALTISRWIAEVKGLV